MQIKQTLLAGCAIAAIALSPAVASAQDTGTPGAGTTGTAPAGQAAESTAEGVGDIVVTARRVQERLQDIPVAVSALSGAQLTQQGIREVRDLNAMVPNLSVQQANAGAGAAVFTIRGQSLSNILLSIDPAVGLYIDGVNVPRAWGVRAALVDIGRVEVLRGPQGTLYGKNSTGGAVSFYTADPTDEFGARAEVSVGNYDSVNANGVLNLPLGQDLAARFVLQRSRHDPFHRSNVTGIGRAKDDTWYGRGKLKYSGENFTAVLTADFTDMDLGGNPADFRGASNFNAATNNALVQVAIETGINPLAISNGPITGATAAAITARGLNPADYSLTPAQRAAALAALNAQTTNNFYRSNSGFLGHQATFSGKSASLDLTWELSDYLKVRSISGYRKFHTETGTDGDATAFTINEARQPTEDRFFSQEFQLLGGDKTLTWVAGLYYSNEKGHLREWSRTTPGIQVNRARLGLSSTPVTLAESEITNKSIGAFAQGNLHVTDALTITAGARWTRETKGAALHNGNLTGSFVNGVFQGYGDATLSGGFGPFVCTIGVNGAVIAPGQDCTRREKDSFKKPSWLLSADYKITPDVLVYAKFATGFKGGGQQARATGASDANYEAFKPETTTEYEIGIKSELFDRRVRFNLAAFRDKYKDIQKNQFVVPPVTIVANAASATIKGVEAELTVRPVEALTLTGNVGYLDAKYGHDANPGCTSPFQVGCFFGQAWPAPKWNYTLGAQYVMPTQVGDLTANVNWTWQDDLALIPESPEFAINAIQKSYGLLSGRIALSIEDWDAEVAVFGRNLTDEKYYTTAIGFQNLGFATSFTGEPRTYGVQFIKRFGSF
jgi:iron complex outermembrane recepter protein